MFLDAHVKPDWGWLPPIMTHLNANYKRAVVPIIPTLDGETWMENKAQAGAKMMFSWDLSFQWFEDFNDLVPCMSGGLYAITKRWWIESGQYDAEMQEWGGENVEQSVRMWLCGGEILVARNSYVSHLFRPKFPYSISGDKTLRNKVMAVEAWFGNYTKYFYQSKPNAKRFTEEVQAMARARAAEISDRLNCKPFQ
eukprot:Filipodium_phascolosomae@DN5747_c0_g1_i1.p1